MADASSNKTAGKGIIVVVEFINQTITKFQPRSQSSLLPVPEERERETLVGSGHVVPEQN